MSCVSCFSLPEGLGGGHSSQQKSVGVWRHGLGIREWACMGVCRVGPFD